MAWWFRLRRSREPVPKVCVQMFPWYNRPIEKEDFRQRIGPGASLQHLGLPTPAEWRSLYLLYHEKNWVWSESMLERDQSHSLSKHSYPKARATPQGTASKKSSCTSEKEYLGYAVLFNPIEFSGWNRDLIVRVVDRSLS